MPEANDTSLISNESDAAALSASEPAAKPAKNSALSFFTTIMAPLGNRNFLLLFSGQTTSTMGDAFYAVALPLIILTSGGSPQELGIVLATYGVPRLITILLGGILSDRIRPRWVMLIADIARALLVGLLAFEVAGGHFSLPILLALVAGLGIFTGLFVPATYSILPDILPKKELQAGNALNSSMLQLATLIGSALAGIVIARLQSQAALAIDALTFAVSAITLAAMSRKPLVESAPQAPSAANAESKDGASATEAPLEPVDKAQTFGQFLRTSRLLQVTVLVVAVTFLAAGGTMGVALPAYALKTLAAGANGYGIALAIFGAGELIGGLVAGGLGHLRHRPVIVLILQLGQAVTFAILPIFSNIGWVFIVLALAGLFNGLINVMYFTLIQEMFPNRFMGRIWGIVMFATYGLYPLSVALGGFVTAQYGAWLMFQASGIALAVAAVIGLLQREIREIV